jgi:hypothetical protein
VRERRKCSERRENASQAAQTARHRAVMRVAFAYAHDVTVGGEFYFCCRLFMRASRPCARELTPPRGLGPRFPGILALISVRGPV